MTLKTFDTLSFNLSINGTLRSLVSGVDPKRQYGLMWKLVLSVIFVVGGAPAQTFQELLLPQPRHIVGVVVEPDGRPVAGATIDHTNDRRRVHQTDSDGRFILDTRAPAFVVRKPGFQSDLIRTQDAAEVRVVLHKLTQDRVLPPCVNGGRYEGIKGWDALLRFPRIPGVKASQQGRDIDYGVRVYFIKTNEGRKGIRHGSGPMWGYGIPSDLDVWRTVKFEETSFVAEGQTITDARGQFANGRRWRYLGRFGESADYSDVDEATAKILDKVIDGACLNSTAARR
jgi:hypothetical protein